MTFFGNSGVVAPELANSTRDAGTRTLEAASNLWAMLSNLESRTDKAVPADWSERVRRASQDFHEAADLYRKISFQFPNNRRLRDLPLSQLDYFVPSYFTPVPFGRFPFWDQTVSELYRELAKGLDSTAIRLQALEVFKTNEELAQDVFRLIRDWNSMSQLGLLIALLNRGPSATGDLP